jgi:hypothetical protein
MAVSFIAVENRRKPYNVVSSTLCYERGSNLNVALDLSKGLAYGDFSSITNLQQ